MAMMIWIHVFKAANAKEKYVTIYIDICNYIRQD